MDGTAQFRRIMTIAGQAARQQDEPVSALHVAFARASISVPSDSTARAIRKYGDERGWGAAPPVSLLDRILRRRPVQYDPAVRRAVERAATNGSPDIRAMLAVMLAEGGLDALRGPVDQAGGSLTRWLAADA